LFQDTDKAQVVPVVFGNGAPEKVLTGRLTDAQVSSKKGKEKEPVSLIQAALDRGREVFLKKQARSHGKEKEQGGKRLSLTGKTTGKATREARKRPVIQPTLSRKLHIVRPGEPGYKRQLHQLRDNTYAVRLVRKDQEQKSKRTQKAEARREAPPPSRRLMGSEGRRIALGSSRNIEPSGPMSSRFSSLNKK